MTAYECMRDKDVLNQIYTFALNRYNT